MNEHFEKREIWRERKSKSNVGNVLEEGTVGYVGK